MFDSCFLRSAEMSGVSAAGRGGLGHYFDSYLAQSKAHCCVVWLVLKSVERGVWISSCPSMKRFLYIGAEQQGVDAKLKGMPGSVTEV